VRASDDAMYVLVFYVSPLWCVCVGDFVETRRARLCVSSVVRLLYCLRKIALQDLSGLWSCLLPVLARSLSFPAG
jgi:hypothetical protein